VGAISCCLMEGENEIYLLSDISNVLSMSNGW
jgi:hypothetical protein